MKKSELVQLIENKVRKTLNEQEMPLDLVMVIASHLSDIQEYVGNKKAIAEINFCKALLFEYARKGKRTMTEDDINKIWMKWVKE